MHQGPVRWASSEGAFLFQVPDEEWLIERDTVILLSGTLYAISAYLETGAIKLNGENLTLIRINFHPPLEEDPNVSSKKRDRYVIHSISKKGLCFQSIFVGSQTTNELSEFENVFLESVVDTILGTLEEEGRNASDIPFLQNRNLINGITQMLHEIDEKYTSLAESWVETKKSEGGISKFDFFDVEYNGKIQVKDLMYDLGERAIESFDNLLLSKEEKIVLYKIAKSLVGLSGLLYGEEDGSQTFKDQLNFAHSEIILQSSETKTLYRLDVRSYTIDEEQICDITIMR